MDDPIFKFDRDKHDARVKVFEEEKIKAACGTIWEKWKFKVKKLPASKRNSQHITKMLMDLRRDLERLANEQVGPWKSYTLTIIDDVIERSNVALGYKPNVLIEYVPNHSN